MGTQRIYFVGRNAQKMTLKKDRLSEWIETDCHERRKPGRRNSVVKKG